VLVGSTLALLSYPFVVWALGVAGMTQREMLLWLTLLLTWPALGYLGLAIWQAQKASTGQHERLQWAWRGSRQHRAALGGAEPRDQRGKP
jgi:hypothetical protein